jgi:hypothetical protein
LISARSRNAALMLSLLVYTQSRSTARRHGRCSGDLGTVTSGCPQVVHRVGVLREGDHRVPFIGLGSNEISRSSLLSIDRPSSAEGLDVLDLTSKRRRPSGVVETERNDSVASVSGRRSSSSSVSPPVWFLPWKNSRRVSALLDGVEAARQTTAVTVMVNRAPSARPHFLPVLPVCFRSVVEFVLVRHISIHWASGLGGGRFPDPAARSRPA